MLLLVLTVVMAVVTSPVLIQNPTDVRFDIAIREPKNVFRIGEEIDLEFRFSSSARENYLLGRSCYPTRRTTLISGDEFVVEPRTGIADPLANTTALIWGGPGTCLGSVIGTLPTYPASQFVSTIPHIQDRILNEWVEFRKPGRYRISATTSRQIENSKTPTALRLTSNTLEIEIVAPEPGWAEKQAQAAMVILKSSSDVDEVLKAGRTIRFLETVEAVPVLVEYFSKSRAGEELRQGLISSPYRKEVVAELEAQIADPDFPITRSWFQTYEELARVADNGPPPKPNEEALSEEYTEANLEARRLWGKDYNAYSAKAAADRKRYLATIANALPRKKGEARITTQNTLQTFGYQP